MGGDCGGTGDGGGGLGEAIGGLIEHLTEISSRATSPAYVEPTVAANTTSVTPNGKTALPWCQLSP